jgi:AraC-like DNA-binding protein
VAILLPPPRSSTVLDLAATAKVAHTWDSLESLLRAVTVDVAVVDPAVGGNHSASLGHLATIRRAHPSLEILLYVASEPSMLRLVGQLGRIGLTDVIVAGVDDDPAALRARLTGSPRGAVAEAVLATVMTRLLGSPLLAPAVQRLFQRPRRYRAVGDLAADAGVSLSTLHRQLRNARVRSPRRLIVAARLAIARDLMDRSGQPMHAVADQAGFSDRDALTVAMREVIGMTPTQARRLLQREPFAARLVASLEPAAVRSAS